MKKWTCMLLAISLVLGTAAIAPAQRNTYQLGDKMDDFIATLSDGTQVSLYDLLETKKAVLINFWASWCSPCMQEFPVMEQVYAQMSDEIGVIALSCEKSDTDEIVLALKEELGLSTLPMGLDDTNLASRFALVGYPTSVMIDRNGIVCFVQVGSITDPNVFIRLFSQFTAKDYQQPVLLHEIPPVQSDVAYPSAASISEALQVADDRISIVIPTDKTVWPFVPAPDGIGVQAANGGTNETSARLILSVEANAGEALQYAYALSCPAVFDDMTVSVDGRQVQYYGGDVNWTQDYVPFETDGAHTVEINFTRGVSQVTQASAALRDVRILSAQQVESLEAQAVPVPKTLQNSQCDIEPVAGAALPIVVIETISGLEQEGVAAAIATDDVLTLRVMIGTDVDEQVAYVTYNAKAILLANLPYDDTGFLLQAQISEPEDENASPYVMFGVCSSAVDMNNAFIKGYPCFASEADVEKFIQASMDMAQAADMDGYSIRWEYADGSPKQSDMGDEQGAVPTDATAQYRITVVDETGAPVPGAMVQICDESTCKVAVTDEAGVVTHVSAPYPYEIHLLKAPDGFASNSETYVFAPEGGEIVIMLQKQ